MDIVGLVADRKIREAMEEGLFDNLPGMGKEIDLSENPFEAPETRMGNRLLRNNGFVPPWVAESKDLDEDRERLERAMAGARGNSAAMAALAGPIAEWNRRVTVFHMKAPGPGQHKRPLGR